MRLKALLFAAVAAFAATPAAHAAGYGEFTGDWRNDDPGTRSITRVRVTPGGGGLTVRVWGECTPVDCDWGSESAVGYSPSPAANPAASATDLTITFNPGFAQKIVVLTDRPGDRLGYTIFTRFTDGSGRQPYVTRGTLRKHFAGWPGWPPGGPGWPPGGPGWPPGGPGGGGGGGGGVGPSPGLTLFEHVGYGGGSYLISADMPNLYGIGWNDIASSIKVSPGETWEVCQNVNYAPPCRMVSGDVPTLVPGGWNDTISSVRRVPTPGGGFWPPGGGGWPPGGGTGGGLSFSEDCINFDWNNVQAQFVGGEWKVVQGSMWMLSFGPRMAEAMQAANIIRSYRFTQQCFIGRPNAPMSYWKRGSGIPSNGMPGDDCVSNNPATTSAVRVGASWKLVDGSHWLLDFGPREAQARQAEEVVRTYRLNRQCFVGRPNASMTYWLSE